MGVVERIKVSWSCGVGSCMQRLCKDHLSERSEAKPRPGCKGCRYQKDGEAMQVDRIEWWGCCGDAEQKVCKPMTDASRREGGGGSEGAR